MLSPEVPDIARERLPGAVDGFLDAHGLRAEDAALQRTWTRAPGVEGREATV